MPKEIQIPFEDFGGEGSLLHFGHANGFPPGAYRAMLEPLLQDFKIKTILHRPLWGNVSPSSFRSWKTMGKDLIALLDQWGGEACFGVGHSMGATSTILAAAQRPDLFKKLVLIDPVVVPKRYYGKMKRTPLFIMKRVNPMAKIALKRTDRWESKQVAYDNLREKRVFQKIPDPVFLDLINASVEKIDGGAVKLRYSKEWEAQVYCTLANPWPSITKLNIPTLVIIASDSNVMREETIDAWKAAQADVEISIFPNSTHLVPMEYPREIADQIRDFLQA